MREGTNTFDAARDRHHRAFLAVEAMVAEGCEPTAAELHSAAIKKAFEELGPVNQTVSAFGDPPSPATEVKPCPKPWCNEALVLEVESKGSGGFRIVCHKCGDRSPWFATRDKLFEVWNHRPGEEAVAEECARIADALAEAPDIELNTIGLSTSDFALYHIRLYARSIARKIRSRFGGKP